MARQFFLIAASTLVLLFAQTDLMAQQKAPIDSDPIASLAEDMDQIVMAPVEAMPDTPSSPILLDAAADKVVPVQVVDGATMKLEAVADVKVSAVFQELTLEFFELDMPLK